MYVYREGYIYSKGLPLCRRPLPSDCWLLAFDLLAACIGLVFAFAGFELHLGGLGALPVTTGLHIRNLHSSYIYIYTCAVRYAVPYGGGR